MNHLTNATAHQRMFMQYFKGSITEIQRVLLDIEKELCSVKNRVFYLYNPKQAPEKRAIFIKKD